MTQQSQLVRGNGSALREGLGIAAERDDKCLWQVFAASIDAIVVIDASDSITAFNPAAERLFGYRTAEVLGGDLAELLIPESHRDRHRRGFRVLAETGQSPILNQRVRVPALRADGTVFSAELTVTQIDDNPLRFAAFVRDITQDVRREESLHQLVEENAQILQSAGDGIYRIDCDGTITYANPAAPNILGYELAELLGQDSHRLFHHSHEDGSSYPAGDCPVLRVLTGGEVVHLTDEVFWRADGTPMPVDYTAAPIRDNGEIIGAVCVFADISEQRERENTLREKASWTQRIHMALREDRFVLFGQPIYAVGEDQPVMHELLVRMQSSEGTLFPPAEFLPQAERFGLMSEIDRWVVGEAMRIARRQPVSVNLSTYALSERGFAGWILDKIAEHGVTPGSLVFEITETAALQEVELAYQLVKRLTDLGCGFALDDFGTGYGAFSELKSLPVTHLKIDRSFVRRIISSPEDQRVVRAIIDVARNFDLKTVAEGVEDEDSYRLLREYGVDYVQGYHFGRPAPLEEHHERQRAN